jgi:hypothetical protein
VIDRFVRRARRSGVSWVRIALLPLAVVLGTTLSFGIAQAGATLYPACQASQIAVTAGATATNTLYPVRTTIGVRQSLAYELVPVYFQNLGPTCHLLMGAPEVRAVRNATDPATISTNDLSAPAGADNTRRMVVSGHGKLEALFVVVKPVGETFQGCDPATATGFTIGGYARPIATIHFVVRKLRDVCFDTGIGHDVIDYGVDWPSV